MSVTWLTALLVVVVVLLHKSDSVSADGTAAETLADAIKKNLEVLCSMFPSKCLPDPGPDTKQVSGKVTLVNCVPSTASNISISVGSASVQAIGSLERMPGNTINLRYSSDVSSTENVPLKLKPSISTCPGGVWRPSTRNVSSLPAVAQDFAYTKGLPISLGLIASTLTAFMKDAQLHLNNYDPETEDLVQDSYFKLGNTTVPLTLDRETIDLDCGRFCPDLGDVYFYISDMNLANVSATAVGDSLVLQFDFESDGTEVKGIYSPGNIDWAVPDFDIDNARIEVTANFQATTQGAGFTLAFGQASFSADIRGGGGCSIFGYDVCDGLLDTGGKVHTRMEESLNAAMGSQMLQDALASGIKTYLGALGLKSSVRSFGVYAGMLYLDLGF